MRVYFFYCAAIYTLLDLSREGSRGGKNRFDNSKIEKARRAQGDQSKSMSDKTMPPNTPAPTAMPVLIPAEGGKGVGTNARGW